MFQHYTLQVFLENFSTSETDQADWFFPLTRSSHYSCCVSSHALKSHSRLLTSSGLECAFFAAAIRYTWSSTQLWRNVTDAMMTLLEIDSYRQSRLPRISKPFEHLCVFVNLVWFWARLVVMQTLLRVARCIGLFNPHLGWLHHTVSLKPGMWLCCPWYPLRPANQAPYVHTPFCGCTACCWLLMTDFNQSKQTDLQPTIVTIPGYGLRIFWHLLPHGC